MDAESSISTLSPGLAVTYIPNQRPQRRRRAHPFGVNLGRSDFNGVEPLMDALDETWSSWMPELRLAKAPLLVAQYMLDSTGPGPGPGPGATFDAGREVFSTYLPINRGWRESLTHLDVAGYSPRARFAAAGQLWQERTRHHEQSGRTSPPMVRRHVHEGSLYRNNTADGSTDWLLEVIKDR